MDTAARPPSGGDVGGSDPGRFLSDVQTLRARARQHIEEGAVTDDYGLDVQAAVRVLNDALATELVCTLRYRQHAFVARGINSEPIAQEFMVHSNEELAHADQIARRIVQLGGTPEYNPDQLAQLSHSEYRVCETLEDMIRENLIAERIAIESYREMVRYFSEHDPTTRAMLETVLAKEEEHADELAELLQDRR